MDHLLERVKDASALTFVKMIIENGHLSVLEFSFLVIRFYVNIGYTCEQNRHRLTSVLSNVPPVIVISRKIGSGINGHFIKGIWFDPTQSKYPEVIDGEMDIWEDNMAIHEQQYLDTVNRLTEKAKQFIEDPTEQVGIYQTNSTIGSGKSTIRYRVGRVYWNELSGMVCT